MGGERLEGMSGSRHTLKAALRIPKSESMNIIWHQLYARHFGQRDIVEPLWDPYGETKAQEGARQGSENPGLVFLAFSGESMVRPTT